MPANMTPQATQTTPATSAPRRAKSVQWSTAITSAPSITVDIPASQHFQAKRKLAREHRDTAAAAMGWSFPSASVVSAPPAGSLDQELFDDKLAFFASDHDSDTNQPPAAPHSKAPKSNHGLQGIQPDNMHTCLLTNIHQDKIRRMGHSMAIRRIHAKLSEISEIVDTIEEELALLVSHV
ncbi:hypothetical protein HYPSUDRAFT_54651 [Hypholoma sublateritium FD-334 SS-4]|uniref:Uncharacterized protein n=1 Tax=Hypholoma sublateritium (strain FD-334 SS-4) TaxID=945553 RepID=A0A0D2MHA9_HYPSF|nr:hypothetical protein HYPSUDRAFT_54651 [Hypholoma sublateritium FD-334 SS-4]